MRHSTTAGTQAFFSAILRRSGHHLLALGLLSLGACNTNKAVESNAEASTKLLPSSSAASAPNSTPAPGTEKPTAKEAAKIISSLPGDEVVQPVVNPRKLPAYAGKTGSVRGIVRVTGDKSPARPEILKKMKASCDDSREMYGTLFREGPNRELADVLVAVTGYDGYVPIESEDVQVSAKGCAWDSRTYVVTFGQRLVIDGLDNRPYVPEILGLPMPAQLFVLPTAPPVQLPPRKPGRFKLLDSMRLYNVAELFVLAYSTFDVTGLDGAFEIKRIPVGKVQVNALLPQTGMVSGQEVIVKAGETTEVVFELPFNLKEQEAKPKPVPLEEIPGPSKSPNTP